MTKQHPVVYVDASDFIYLDDFKTPIKLDSETAEIEFMDKNKHTSRLRGTPFVRVDLAHFAESLYKILARGRGPGG